MPSLAMAAYRKRSRPRTDISENCFVPLSSPLASSGDRSRPRRPWPPPNEDGDELRTRRFDLPVGWGGRLLLLEGVSGGRSREEEEEEEGGGVVDTDRSVGPAEEADTAEDGGRPLGLRRDFSEATAAIASSPLCLLRFSGVIEGEVVLGGNDVDAPKPPPPPIIKDVLSFFGDNIPGK